MNKLKNSILALTILMLSFSFLGLQDSGDYIISGNTIIRGPSKMYLVGTVNLKFKDNVGTFGNSGFNISNLDRAIGKFDLSSIKQLHPLNNNPSKRAFGDEELAKIFEIKYSAGVDPFDVSKSIYEANKDILDWVEPSFVYQAEYVPNDPVVASQYHISKINAYQAWDLSKGDTNVIIGIVDSGSDINHPDLNANFKYNWADPVNGVDDDANGYIDDFLGWDFADNDNDPNCGIQDNDHGSHVSGCATQVADNGIHGAGPGFRVKFRISKHSNSAGQGLYYTDAGVVYMYQNGVKVINCSFGSDFYSSYSQLVMNNAWNSGVVVCASAGNQSTNGPRYPASYDNVVSVAATNNNDLKTWFSNYHTTVDISAPGEGILSTLWLNGYASLDGTSMSSPITAGVVGLIRSMYPSWTPAQVVQRLLLGVDSIYSLNPSYVGLLGTGRVNAFKCLSDNPIVRINSVSHNDSIYGNNDKVYDINEVIPIAVNLKNTHFGSTNASIRLTTTSSYVTIVQDSVYIGNIPAYGNVATNFNNTFKVKANESCPFDVDVVFKLAYSSTAYSDNSANTFTIRFRQGFAVHSVNNLKLCLTKDGAVGKKTQAYGTGLQIGNGTSNNIYEGGLMIGISNTQVSDVSRRGQTPANVSDTDFVALDAYRLTSPGTVSNQDGSGKFNDDGAGASKIGVEVQSNSYAFNTIDDMDYILLKYKIKNTNPSVLNNVYAGIYIWYAPDGTFNTNNISRFNSTEKVGYTYNTGISDSYYGLGLMTNQNVNFKAYTSTEVFNGFTTQEKWDGLSAGLSADSLGPGGISFVVSAGPFNIQPGQSETVGFAIIKANNVADLIMKNNRAKIKYQSVGIKTISEEIPVSYELMQNYPNPFNPVTNIKFSIPKDGNVSIKVYDMLGREVSELVREFKKAGIYEVSMNANSLSSGVYFYRIQTGNFTDMKKMVVVK